VVRRLKGLHPPVPSELVHLLGVVVRDADVPDLALPHQVLEDPCRLLRRRPQVGPVDLVQIDVVGTQVTEARLRALSEPAGARVPEQRLALHAEPALGGDDHVVAARSLPQRVGQETLGHAEAVGLGRVEERDA
jgi:hypothetical protein